jgi:hypothetical protein
MKRSLLIRHEKPKQSGNGQQTIWCKSPENQTWPEASLACLHLLSSGDPLAMANPWCYEVQKH